MAIEENGAMNSMVMPVSPMYGGGNNAMFGDNWAWIILLLLLVGNGGWGNNGYGNGGNLGGALYPWINQTETVNNGFRDQAIVGQLNGIQNGVNGISTQMCQGFNQLGGQVANAGFQNALATANLQSVVQAENCADRTAVSDGVRDIIANQNAGFQSIKDYINQLDSNAKDNEIANLRAQLNMSNLAASQGAQTAQIIADNNAQTAQLISRIAPYPVPSWTVPNPYNYSNVGCGCGCNA